MASSKTITNIVIRYIPIYHTASHILDGPSVTCKFILVITITANILL